MRPDFSPQGPVIGALWRMIAAGTLPHAVLVTGEKGAGKRTLATLLSQALLCERGDDRPCGQCPACLQVAEGNHPDLQIVQPGKALADEEKVPASAIGVYTIRKLEEIMSRAPYAGTVRCVQIRDAHRMNEQAQNALLRTLEEPPAGNTLFLITDQPALLLSTIRSRCHEVKLHPWPDDALRRILAEHGVRPEQAERVLPVCEGSVGRALELAGDTEYWSMRTEVIGRCLGMERRSDILPMSSDFRENKQLTPDFVLDTLESALRMVLQASLGTLPVSSLTELPPVWHKAAEAGDYQTLIRLLDAVSETRRMQQSHVSWQASLEQLQLKIMEAVSRWSK